jgi:cytochrome c oxidase assembly protein subunit 11
MPWDLAKKQNAITALAAVAGVAAMTVLAFSFPALYRAFCEATGFGGTTQVATQKPTIVEGSAVTVSFDANVGKGTELEFKPHQRSMTLRLGETGVTFYTVTNVSDRPIIAQATYNVTPNETGAYFAKLQCFCFQEQVFAPGKSIELPVVFFVMPDILKNEDVKKIKEITLSYTFAEMPGSAARAQELYAAGEGTKAKKTESEAIRQPL